MSPSLSRRQFLQGAALGSSLMFVPGAGRVIAQSAGTREFPTDYGGRLCYNENPLGPGPNALRALYENAVLAHRYPDWYHGQLEDLLSDHHGVYDANICAGAGATEIIRLVADAFLGPGDEVVSATPSYTQMDGEAVANGASVVNVSLDAAYRVNIRQLLLAVAPATRMLSLVNPNNPTGTILYDSEIDFLISELPDDVILVVDEAYWDFVSAPGYASCIPKIFGNQPLVVIRTMSKAYGLAGARIGYSVARTDLTEQIAGQQIYATISRPSQAAAMAALHDSAHVAATVDLNNAAMEILVNGVQSLGLEYIPSHTNFIMIDVGMDGGWVREALYGEGYRVRSGYGMPNHIRVSTGTLEETQGLVNALELVLAGRSTTAIEPRQASSFGLGRLYPNPVNDHCRITLSIPESGRVTLEIYDLQGRRVNTPVNRHLPAGRHDISWAGKDILGRPVASGTYVVFLRQGELAASREITVIR